jgi:aldose 1-epimerase
VLGFDSLDGYLQEKNPFFGSLIGPYANRIAGSAFTLNGKKYNLISNDRGNTLHGGAHGFHKAVWKITRVADNTLRLRYRRKDGQEGFPGNLEIEVIYTLTEDDSLQIGYKAVTDRPTPVNLTSHCYFNLSAGKEETILGHHLLLHAGKYLPVDELAIPIGKMAEAGGTPMDFRREKMIGKDIQKVKGGFDHNWVLDRRGQEIEKVGSLWDPGSGRLMEVLTTTPGIQFYSGNSLDGSLTATVHGARYDRHAGLCLEAQSFPDSPNQEAFPDTILHPGQTYRQTTIYKFSVRNPDV